MLYVLCQMHDRAERLCAEINRDGEIIRRNGTVKELPPSAGL
jgi:hypothetical protein